MNVRSRTELSSPLVTTIQVLMVRCGSTYLGVPADLSHGVLEPDNLGSDGAVSGLGHKYPITDLAGRLGLPVSSTGPGTRIILCARGGAQKAIQIDELFGLTDIEQRRIRSLPLHFTGPERDWFAGLFVFQDRIAFLINAAWLLSDDAETLLPISLRETASSSRLLALPPVQQTSGEDPAFGADQPESLN
jgi:hypothetical protein